MKYYSKSPLGQLRASILLGYYMKTKFFFYDETKLQLIKELFDVAKLINETKNFRLTNDREIMIGAISISMNLLDKFTCDEIVSLIKGLTRVSLGNGSKFPAWDRAKEASKFFKSQQAFLTAMLTEQKYLLTEHAENEMPQPDTDQDDSDTENIEELKVYFVPDNITMMNYHNNDYEIPKLGQNGSGLWMNVFKILEKRLTIFSKITNVIRRTEFKTVSSGIIFQFTKHASELHNNLTIKNDYVDVLPMLNFVYKTLREHYIPFRIIVSPPCGRPLFIMGHESMMAPYKMHLDDLYFILSSDVGCIDILSEMCQLDAKDTESFSQIMWNFNNNRALFRWMINSFKDHKQGIKFLVELRSDILADEFKGIVKIFIPDDLHETNGLLLIRSGVYGLLLSTLVLHEIDSDERLTMIRSFNSLKAREELMNVVGKIFNDRKI